MWHAWGGERCSQGFGWEARREEGTNKMDLREIGFDGAKWIRLAQNRAFVNTVMNLRIHKECRLFIEKLGNYQLLK
jgi:hypothetical protein